MKRVQKYRLVIIWAAVGLTGVLAGCAAGGVPEQEEEVECTVDSDCPGVDRVCDLLTHSCTARGDGPTDTGTPDEMEDGGDGVEDSGSMPDSGDPDTGITDTGSMDSSDEDDDGGSGGSEFSGCSTDGDCSGYLVCNSQIGRCEDPRPECDGDGDCGSGERCIASRCVQECRSGSCGPGRSCSTIDPGPNTAAFDVCLTTCQPFSGTGSGDCNEDRECIPFFGASEGLCRGVGRNTRDETCSTGYGPDGCAEGNLCVDNRGDERCQPLCAESSSPDCGSGSYCAIRFSTDRMDNEVSNPTGWCHENCGGLGGADNGQCSAGEGCQPDSPSGGFCTKLGSATSGDLCGQPGSPYCRVGNICLPATVQDRGMCRTLCDPRNSKQRNNCADGEACLQLEPGYGVCLEACPDPGGRSVYCKADRPYCVSATGMTTTPSEIRGLCTVP